MSRQSKREDQLKVPKRKLSRETLRDLDTPRAHAHEVKGGGCGLHMNDSCCKAATISKKMN